MDAPHDWTQVQPEKKWTILSKQKRFAFWALYTSIGSMMSGFDGALAGTVTAMPAFQRQMGIPYPSQPSGYLIPAYASIPGWAGVTTAGEALGVMVAGQFMERFGRKLTILVGTIITAAGIGMQVASQEWTLFLGGRLVNAFGFGFVFVSSPVWIGEVVRPELRGTFLCLMNGSIVLAQFLLALAAYGCESIDGHWSYQTLVVLQFVFVAGLLIFWPFFPESPYYLIKKGQPEKALKALERVHGKGDQTLIDAEMIRLQTLVETTANFESASGSKGVRMLQIFRKSHLKRTIIAMLPAGAQQLIGAAFVLNYITYFMSLLGIEEFFTVSVVLYVIMLVSNISAFPLIEIVGRRPLLLWGIIALNVILIVMGVMGFVMNSAALWVILVCIFLWAIAYQLSLGAVGFALASEVPSPDVRPATTSIAGLTRGVTGWVIGFVSPYMINPDAGNLGARVGLVFAGLGVPLAVAFWFLIPETLGLSYSELDTLFEDKVKPRHFKKEMLKRRLAETQGINTSEDGQLKGNTTHVSIVSQDREG